MFSPTVPATSPTISLADLKRVMPAEPGMARDCTVIARGWRGDDSVRREISAICRSAAHPNVRAAAVVAFSWIGTADDLRLLEEVAERDPYSVELTDYERRSMMLDLLSDSVIPKMVYPNRQRAQHVISRIHSKARKSATDLE